jgi:hypothetical protein
VDDQKLTIGRVRGSFIAKKPVRTPELC